jgi:hypothetical protein
MNSTKIKNFGNCLCFLCCIFAFYFVLTPFDGHILDSFSLTPNLFVISTIIAVCLVFHICFLLKGLELKSRLLFLEKGILLSIGTAFIVMWMLYYDNEHSSYILSKSCMGKIVNEKIVFFLFLAMITFINYVYCNMLCAKTVKVISVLLSYLFFSLVFLYCGLAADYFKYYSLSVNCDTMMREIIDVKLNYVVWMIWGIMIILFAVRNYQINKGKIEKKYIVLLCFFHLSIALGFYIADYRIEKEIKLYSEESIKPHIRAQLNDFYSGLKEISENNDYLALGMSPWRVCFNRTRLCILRKSLLDDPGSLPRDFGEE